jgi:hypothetical protein
MGSNLRTRWILQVIMGLGGRSHNLITRCHRPQSLIQRHQKLEQGVVQVRFALFPNK